MLAADGRIAAVNDALRVTGGPAGRRGVRPEALFMPDDAAAVAAAIDRTIGQGGFQQLRAALLIRPGEKQPVSIMPVPPGFGVSAILAIPDVREQLRLERQVEAVTRMQAVGQLAGGVAHDFNNVLTAILALTEQLLVRHDDHADSDNADLVQIRDNAQRAAALVAQLLAFARQQPQQRRVLDLGDIVQGLRPLLRQLLGTNINLTIDSPALGHAVRADAGQIEQIVVNLAVNARDAMNGQGALAIRVFEVAAANVARERQPVLPEADYVALSVTDDGEGIAPAIRGKIFEPFFTTKPQGKGTGLGLSTVYGVVKQSGGYVFADPAPGDRGARFTVYLPAVARERMAQPPVVTEPAVEEPGLPTGARVLLVEDEPAVRAVLTRTIARLGVEVTAVEGGEEALALLANQKFEMLVSDVMMPGIDGVTLAERARQGDPSLGIVLMSGFAQPPLRDAASRQGIEFLAKPFAAADLAAAISRAHRRLPEPTA